MDKFVDTSKLPRRGKNIAWKNSIGYICPFKYADILGEITIIGYEFSGKIGVLHVSYQNKEYDINTDNFLYGNLARVLGLTTSDFRYDIGEVISRKTGELTILNHEYRVGNTATGDRKWKWYECQCNNCGQHHWMVESQLTHNGGCPYCGSSHKLCFGVNDITTTDPWMIDYFQGGFDEAKNYTHASPKKIYPKCPICGRVSPTLKKIGDIYKYHSIGCPCYGGYSYPETIMHNILTQCGVEFIYHTNINTFPWAGRISYDFYIPSLNCIIETHGAQHYSENTMTLRTLEEERQNDVKKKSLAIKNGITNYFEVNCSISRVDWIMGSCNDCGLLNFLNMDSTQFDFQELSLSKYAKEIVLCRQILDQNPTIKFADLSRELGFRHRYDTERVLDLCGKSVRTNRIPVALYDGDTLVETFSSLAEASRYSMGKDFQASIATLHKYINQHKIIKDHYHFDYFWENT